MLNKESDFKDFDSENSNFRAILQMFNLLNHHQIVSEYIYSNVSNQNDYNFYKSYVNNSNMLRKTVNSLASKLFDSGFYSDHVGPIKLKDYPVDIGQRLGSGDGIPLTNNINTIEKVEKYKLSVLGDNTIKKMMDHLKNDLSKEAIKSNVDISNDSESYNLDNDENVGD